MMTTVKQVVLKASGTPQGMAEMLEAWKTKHSEMELASLDCMTTVGPGATLYRSIVMTLRTTDDSPAEQPIKGAERG